MLHYSNPRSRTIAGTAEHLLHSLASVPPKSRILPVARNSKNYGRLSQLMDSCNSLCQAIEERGCVVIDPYLHTGTIIAKPKGHPDDYDNDAHWLLKPIRKALRLKADYLLVECLDRLTRHPRYGVETNKIGATQFDVDRLDFWCNILPIAVLFSSEANPAKQQKHQQERGKKASGNYGGRPRKLTRKQRRDLLMARAINLHRQGLGCRTIAKKLRQETRIPISHMTVNRWLNGM